MRTEDSGDPSSGAELASEVALAARPTTALLRPIEPGTGISRVCLREGTDGSACEDTPIADGLSSVVVIEATRRPGRDSSPVNERCAKPDLYTFERRDDVDEPSR